MTGIEYDDFLHPDYDPAPDDLVCEFRLKPAEGMSMEAAASRVASESSNGTWAALDVANMDGITTRLHWTDKPYKWHVNDGEEVFVVLDGEVEMRYMEDGSERRALLSPGDIFFASIGTEHVAHPRRASRVLVIEKEGSV